MCAHARVTENWPFTPALEMDLDADRAERVTQDAIVRLGDGSKKEARPDHPFRLITIACKPHRKQGRSQRYARNGSTGPASDGVLRRWLTSPD